MDNLIYDRTQLDVINLTSKGYYNYIDLNRVEKWCRYLGEKLNSYSYPVNIITKMDWTMLDFPMQSDMERIRTNLETLKNAYYSFANLPAIAENMDYKKANAIERILHEIDYLMERMENNFVYSGVAGCGQARVWQQRFRKNKTWISQPYKLSQYADLDTLRMIATDSNASIVSSTKILGLAVIDKRDDVYASIQSINNSMQILDGLVGA